MDSVTIFFIVGCLLTAAMVYVVVQVKHFGEAKTMSDQLLKAQTEASTNKKKLLGYTHYADCLEASKLVLMEQMKAPVAKVVREYVHVAQLPKDEFKLKAEATVIATYTVEFGFGVDTSPSGFELTAAANGMGLKMSRPTLVGEPVVKAVSHRVVSSAELVEEKAVMAQIQAKFAELARRYGVAMSTEPAVQALCKLKALESLRDALARQPGVRHLPGIFVDFK
ncbi:MAG: hypothetical protein GW928_01330 [Rhodoferax sp.]|nr:hypothetical protein [Betaproteobacteria bacterium]NCN96123.1 hypothetical protein [Rhodoferax sp.]OIP15519.1 MAG: hypothetical protein AUK50_10475 [Comamonadaceae bacterium CG2_30_57_122]PIZ21363.1 MAG: hypothetical protein COY49_14180 [Comamonadaceae bacterium CG_4_10_14_0_8_um_filter_57_29]PJC13801.1 MAG: hypothetical protein CO065_15560 [Comamonadaceae bacterium CG_4_9_14_0_8_um_filter_57_21]